MESGPPCLFLCTIVAAMRLPIAYSCPCLPIPLLCERIPTPPHLKHSDQIQTSQCAKPKAHIAMKLYSICIELRPHLFFCFVLHHIYPKLQYIAFSYILNKSDYIVLYSAPITLTQRDCVGVDAGRQSCIYCNTSNCIASNLCDLIFSNLSVGLSLT